MINSFHLLILILGASGLVAQLLLLRVLFVNYSGNELTLGIVLANWIVSEAAGVFSFGKLIDRTRDKIRLVLRLELLFSLLFPLAVFMAGGLKNIMGLPFGESVGLYATFFSSLLILFPVAFCHGAIFSVCAKIYPQGKNDAVSSLGKVYALENIGSILGGLTLTYLFIPYLDPIEAAFFICAANLIACLLLAQGPSYRKLKLTILIYICLILYLFSSAKLDLIKTFSIKRQYAGLEVLDERNSVYGNIAVTKNRGQLTFFYNGLPIITSPYPDITFVEEFGNIPLLFHPSPKSLLIIGRGSGGLINEFLKYPLERIDYAELDPLLIRLLKKYPTRLTDKEMSDKRVRVINSDGRFFLRNTLKRYDLILIGLSEPSDLSVNRLFSQEFFMLAAKKLNPQGILALWLPSSLSYLSQELINLHASILNGLRLSYHYVRIIPGDFNIFLASNSSSVRDTDAGLLSQRLTQHKVTTKLLVPEYLAYRLDKKWLDFYLKGISRARYEVNRDFKPVAVFEMLKSSEKRFSPKVADLLTKIQNLNLSGLSVLIFVFTLLFYFVFFLKPELSKARIAYAIATTGFFAMTANLVLIFAFQVFYGNLYYALGILETIFMAGIASGSIFMTMRLSRLKGGINLFRVLESAVILFSLSLASMLGLRFLQYFPYPKIIFAGSFFISGALAGSEFPLAAKLYLRNKEGLGSACGLLYAADLLGGWLSGIFAGVLLLPLLGIFQTCMVVVLLKLSSLFLMGGEWKD